MKLFNDNLKHEKILFNHFWKFKKTNIDVSYSETLKDINSFIDVALPHDYLINQVNNLYETSSGWYYKEFELNNIDKFKYFINFDGVYMDSTIYINNELAFEWKNGYSAFEFEITNYCKNGNNKIMVRVNHENPNSRWYSGAGIFRDVTLIKKSLNYIKSNGVYINTNHQTKSVYIKTDLNLLESVVVEHNILFKDKKILKNQIITNKNSEEVTLELSDIKLWSPNNPNIYTLETNVYINNNIVDSVRNNFGFKDIVISPSKGLYINGIKTKLNGVCEHHDLGALGAAFSKKIMRNRIKMLKDMGVNAIRTAHSIPAKGLMELADEMGILIISEAFDMWELPKNKFDYARFFKEWVNKDVESWITRDRNHVSLLMWSIGNEIYDTHVSLKGVEITKKLKALILKYDPKQNGFITIGSNFLMGENTQKAANELKVVGYNYLEHLYDEHSNQYKDWIIYGSETSSIVKSRGVYHFPLEEQILYHEDKQCSSLGNSLTSWGSKSLEESITIDRDISYSLGQFIWTGHDYIGEPTPYDTKNSYFGQIDTAGFPKDTYYVHRASWSNQDTLHIFPYWNFNEGEMIDVRVATNQPKIEVYLNNKLIRTKNTNIKTDLNIIPTFKIPYEKGELKVISYDNNNNVIKSEYKRTFGDPVKIKVNVLDNILKADGKDLTEIIIETIDENNNVVEDDNQLIEVIVNGPGKLLGLDNGDSTDFTDYKGSIKPMFSGKLKAFVGSLYEEGKIEVEIKSIYLSPVSVNIDVKKVELHGESKKMQELNSLIRPFEFIQKENEAFNFIPIRRIKLKAGNKKINKEQNEVFVETKIFPINSTPKDLNYKIVTKKGIETDIATIKKVENGVIVKGVKDGTFVLRASSNNLKKHTDIISELTFTVEGISPAYKNPFKFITAGLYDEAIGEIKSGNEHGVATSSNDQTEIVFNNVNFEQKNSNIINLSIFSFESSSLWVKIYFKNSIDKEFQLIDQVTYYKETIWNMYQEEKYKLPVTLSGNNDIKLVFERSVHFKGFYFDQISNVNREINILEASTYYGDSYVKTKDGFEAIGNNTTFIFKELFFEEEVDTLEIYGFGPINNSIRLILTDDKGLKNTIQLEFEKSNSYKNKTFRIPKIKGIYQVEFVFLPGSNFNFKTFKFSNRKE